MRSIQRCRDDSRGAAAAAASSCARTPALIVDYLRGSWRTFLGRIRSGRVELDLESRYRRESRQARAREEELQARNRAYFDFVLNRMTAEERAMTEALHSMVEELGVMEGTIEIIGRTDPAAQADLEALLESRIGDPSEELATIRGPEGPRCAAPGPEDATPGSASASQEMFSPPAMLSSMDPTELGADAMDAFETAKLAGEVAEARAERDLQLAREHAAQIGRQADADAEAALTLAGISGRPNDVPQAAPPPLPFARPNLIPHRLPESRTARTLKRPAPSDDEDEERRLGKKRKEQEGGKRTRKVRRYRHTRKANRKHMNRKTERRRRRKPRR